MLSVCALVGKEEATDFPSRPAHSRQELERQWLDLRLTP